MSAQVQATRTPQVPGEAKRLKVRGSFRDLRWSTRARHRRAEQFQVDFIDVWFPNGSFLGRFNTRKLHAARNDLTAVVQQALSRYIGAE